MANVPSLTYEQTEVAVNYIISCIPQKPKVGIICGRNLSGLADVMENKIDIAYESIPDYPQHAPDPTCVLTYGTCEDIPMLCFRRRFYLGEGYTADNVILPIKILKMLGAQLVILTNTANALNPDYSIGDVMIVKDHINLVGFSGNSTIKSSDPRWGFHPVPMNYNQHLREKAMKVFTNSSFERKVHEGVFVCSGGSEYQTVAEAQLLKQLGGDAVGASIAHEALAAAHCDLDVLAVSVIFGISAADCSDLQATEMLQPLVKLYMEEIAPDFKPEMTEVAEEGTTPVEPASEAEVQAPPIEPKQSTGTQHETESAPGSKTSAEKPAPPAPEAGETPQKKKKYCECKSKKSDTSPKSADVTPRASATAEKPVDEADGKKKKNCACRHKQQQTE